jgi:hypothetical protein
MGNGEGVASRVTVPSLKSPVRVKICEYYEHCNCNRIL